MKKKTAKEKKLKEKRAKVKERQGKAKRREKMKDEWLKRTEDRGEWARRHAHGRLNEMNAKCILFH